MTITFLQGWIQRTGSSCSYIATPITCLVMPSMCSHLHLHNTHMHKSHTQFDYLFYSHNNVKGIRSVEHTTQSLCGGWLTKTLCHLLMDFWLCGLNFNETANENFFLEKVLNREIFLLILASYFKKHMIKKSQNIALHFFFLPHSYKLGQVYKDEPSNISI